MTAPFSLGLFVSLLLIASQQQHVVAFRKTIQQVKATTSSTISVPQQPAASFLRFSNARLRLTKTTKLQMSDISLTDVTQLQDPSVLPSSDVQEEANTGSSVAASVFNLAKTILGAGVLSLPSGVAVFSDNPIALYPACAVLVAMGLLSAYSFSSIGRACAISDSKTFSQAWYKLVSPKSAKGIAAMITFRTFLTCLIYSMILGDLFAHMSGTFGVTNLLLRGRTNVILSLTATAILPLCCLKKLDALKYTSLLGMGGVVYCTAFMVLRFLDGSYTATGRFFPLIAKAVQPSFNIAGPKPWYLVFGLLSMMSTAYVAHYSAPKFYTELKNTSMQRFNAVTAAGFGFSILTYLIVICVGFLTFGGNSTGFILNNYASSDILATFARLAMGLGILCSYPLTFTALREGLFDVAGIEDVEKRNRITVPITAAVMTPITLLALGLNNVGSVVGFSGALTGATLIYLIPAVMNIAAMRKTGAATGAVEGIIVAATAEGSSQSRFLNWLRRSNFSRKQRAELAIAAEGSIIETADAAQQIGFFGWLRNTHFTRRQRFELLGNAFMALVGMSIAVMGVGVALFAS